MLRENLKGPDTTMLRGSLAEKRKLIIHSPPDIPRQTMVAMRISATFVKDSDCTFFFLVAIITDDLESLIPHKAKE